MDFGSIVMVVVLLVVLPVAVLMSMAALAGALGGAIRRNSDTNNLNEQGEPNEYLELSRTNPYDR